jgi:hypothetical protein
MKDLKVIHEEEKCIFLEQLIIIKQKMPLKIKEFLEGAKKGLARHNESLLSPEYKEILRARKSVLEYFEKEFL